MKNPVQCVLWEQPELVFGKGDGDRWDRLEVLDRFIDDSHLSRFLVKCHECGQLYVYEDYEVSWSIDEDEPYYNILLPVDSAEEAKNLQNTRSEHDLLHYFPRLQYDSKKKTPKWNLAKPKCLTSAPMGQISGIA